MWSNHRQRWRDLLPVVFGEWSLLDLQAALQMASTLEEPYREQAVRTVLEIGFEQEPTNVIEISRALGLESTAQQLNTESQVMSLVDDPNRALDQVASANIGEDRQRTLIRHMLDIWIHRDGIEPVLPLLQKLQATYGENKRLLVELVSSIAEHDPERTWEYMLSTPTEVQNRLREGILFAWVESDPQRALIALTEQESPELLYLDFNQAVDAWGYRNPKEVLENLDWIPPEHVESAIADAIRRIAEDESVMEAERLLKELKSRGEPDGRAISALVHTVGRLDPVAAVALALSHTEEDGPERDLLLLLVLPKLALVDPVQAMKTAHEHPYDESSYFSGMDDDVVEGLASNGRLTEAKEALGMVREPMRMKSYAALGMAYIEFDQPEEAINLADDLSKSDRIEYFKSVAYTWFFLNPDHVVSTLVRLPEEDERDVVAREILGAQQIVDHLWPQQIEYVKTFLQEKGGTE